MLALIGNLTCRTMAVNDELTLTSRPKATNQRMLRKMSMGQWMKLPEKGRSHIKAKRSDKLATTMV